MIVGILLLLAGLVVAAAPRPVARALDGLRRTPSGGTAEQVRGYRVTGIALVVFGAILLTLG